MADQKKVIRVLYLFEQMARGQIVKKNELAELFQTSPKTIQRDIDDLRGYCAEMTRNGHCTYCGDIEYSSQERGYRINRKTDQQWLGYQDILGISRILLESRALEKEEMKGLLQRLASQSEPQENEWIKEIIRNEQYHYQPLRHGKKLLKNLWELGQAVRQQQLVQLHYRKESNGEMVVRLVEPQSVLFSEYYFYLIAYIHAGGYEFPAIYRLDRIEDYQIMNDKFSRRSEKDRFEDGEFRKRIQFMTPGPLMRLRIKCYSKSLEAVMDRLPTAQIVEQADQYTLIDAEVFGGGIVWWILSQGEMIEVLEPRSLRNEVAEKIAQSLARYKTDNC